MSTMVHVITGAGSGIGRALALRLAHDGEAVIAVGRREQPLSTLADTNSLIEPCPADVSTPAGQAAIEAALGDRAIGYLVHNAGVLEPVGPLLAQSAEAIRASLAINVEAPLALSARLRPRMRAGGRILHLSSGAAHRGLPGWGAYCLSKSALNMAYQVLAEELADSDIAIGSLRPGVVDTPMQALIREQSSADFPAVESFRAMKAEGELASAETVAAFTVAVLRLPDAQAFSAKEWDIRVDGASLMNAD